MREEKKGLPCKCNIQKKVQKRAGRNKQGGWGIQGERENITKALKAGMRLAESVLGKKLDCDAL